MRNTSYRVLGIVCVLALSAAAPAWADAPLADKVPAGAIVYAGWAGKTPALDGSLLGELLNDPAVGTLLGMAKTALLGKAGPEDRVLVEHGWALADTAWRHPAAGALLDFQVEEKTPILKAFVLIDLGKDKDAFAAHADAIVKWVVETKHAVSEPVTAGAMAYTRLRLEDKNAPPLAYGYIGPMFFFAVGEGVPEALAAVKPETSLQADKGFQAAHKLVAHENEQLTYCANMVTFLDRVKKASPASEAGAAATTRPGPDKIVALNEAMGFGSATRFVWSASVAGRNLLIQGRVLSPAPHRGLMMLGAGAPLADDALAHVPADAHLAAAINLSPADFYGEIRRVVRSISPEGEADMVKGEEQVGKMLGLSVTEDLLPAFGDTWTLASAPSWGGAFTGTLLTVQVKDAAKAANALAKIEAFLFRTMGAGPDRDPGGDEAVDEARPARPTRRGGASLQTRQAGPTTIKYLAFRGQPVPVAPAWTIHGGRLYVGLWPQVVEAAIAGKPAMPLIASPAYKALRERVGKDASALIYADGGAIVRDLYHVVLIGWTVGSGELAKILPAARPDWLPPLATLQKYLPPEMVAVSPDAGGITFRSESALGGLTVAASIVPGAAAVALPALAGSVESARKNASATNLRSIGMACRVYQANNNAKYPPDLGALLAAGGLDPSVLKSPMTGGKQAPPRLVDGKLVGRVDYVYLCPADPDKPGSILVYERPENYDHRGTWILDGDCNLRWLTMEALQEALEKAIPARERVKEVRKDAVP